MGRSAPAKRKSPANSAERNARPRIRQRIAAVIAAVATLLAGWLLWPQVSAWRHWNLGEQSLENREFAAAVEHFRIYADIYPTSALARFQLARTLRLAERYAEAQELLQSCNWIPEEVELEKS